MPIFEVKGDQLVAVAETSFSAEGIYERKHIQQLLKAHIGVLDERLMVIAEEFGDTPSSKYRELFMQRLTASVMADRTGMYASNLGYNGDNSDNIGKPLPREVTVTYTP